MKKFVVVYRVPLETMQKWKAETPPEEMKKQGEELGQKMMAWMEKNKASIVDNGMPLGKNTRATMQGVGIEPKVEEVSNDLNAFVIVQADSAGQVVEMFKDNPHNMIPTGYVDIMEVPHMGM
jgi:hypothetical protein